MKNAGIFFLVVLGLGLVLPLPRAEAIWLPFAGKVVTTFAPGIVCVGEGPITIAPVGLAPVGPYVITFATIRYSQYTVLPGSWILGLYSTVPIPGTCATTSLPPVPVPAFAILRFGSSLPSL